MTEGFRREELLFMMKKISLNLTAQLELNLKNKGMTGSQVYFLVYILRHHPDGTYLTELCREIGVSKATLSALIKKLREKEYLYFLTDPDDVRKKKSAPHGETAGGRRRVCAEGGSDGRRNLQRARPEGESPALESGAEAHEAVCRNGTH